LAVVLLHPEGLAVDGELALADSVGVASGDGVVCWMAGILGFGLLVGGFKVRLLGVDLSVTVVGCVIIAKDDVNFVAGFVLDKQIRERRSIRNKLFGSQHNCSD